ncbi:MAG TPA: hypothetical protein VKA89_11310 [Solirubrobacterales bacterium]|nr:hypothetical protein [Solirubrobacterales bacterium]
MADQSDRRAEEALREKQEEAKAKAQEGKMRADERPQDEASPRAKSSGHKKMTADKWNQ